MRLVHISDTHFGTEVPEVVQALTSRIHELKPEIIVLSGDLTQRARRGQFNRASDFLVQFSSSKVLVVPGNHDIPLFNLIQRFWRPYLNYEESGFTREVHYQVPGLHVLTLDATCRWRHTRGCLSEASVSTKLESINRTRKEGSLLFVSVHQPLIVDRVEEQGNLLIYSNRFLELFARHAVDLVMSGHIHLPLITTTKLNEKLLSRHFLFSGAGTAISHRIRQFVPNSFNVIEWNTSNASKRISIIQNNFDKNEGRFSEVAIHHFSCTPSGWAVSDKIE